MRRLLILLLAVSVVVLLDGVFGGATAGAAGVSVTAVDVTEPNLEAVFLHLTGKALRDET